MSFVTAIERVEIETAFIHSVTIIWTQLRSNLDAYGDFCPRLAPYLDPSSGTCCNRVTAILCGGWRGRRTLNPRRDGEQCDCGDETDNFFTVQRAVVSLWPTAKDDYFISSNRFVLVSRTHKVLWTGMRSLEGRCAVTDCPQVWASEWMSQFKCGSRIQFVQLGIIMWSRQVIVIEFITTNNSIRLRDYRSSNTDAA